MDEGEKVRRGDSRVALRHRSTCNVVVISHTQAPRRARRRGGRARPGRRVPHKTAHPQTRPSPTVYAPPWPAHLACAAQYIFLGSVLELHLSPLEAEIAWHVSHAWGNRELEMRVWHFPCGGSRMEAEAWPSLTRGRSQADWPREDIRRSGRGSGGLGRERSVGGKGRWEGDANHIFTRSPHPRTLPPSLRRSPHRSHTRLLRHSPSCRPPPP
jgi:hypothetical protein